MAKYTQTTSVSLSCPACGDEHVVKIGMQSGISVTCAVVVARSSARTARRLGVGSLQR